MKEWGILKINSIYLNLNLENYDGVDVWVGIWMMYSFIGVIYDKL